ncbi:extracellular solute-binding protein [Gloeomargarita lithophora]|uniref:extracellular solute-binding protein n=1 Tax=Gloeomargarita lithophora TaxID=1188228 RepID=UPI003F721895
METWVVAWQRSWSRRALLAGGGGALAGCAAWNPADPLRIHVLKNSLPPLWLRRFRRRHALELQSHPQLPDLYEQLTQPIPPNLVSLGLAWLDMARQAKHLTPLDPTRLTRWAALPPVWRALIQPQGQLWWVPYRWGTTVLAYRRDKLDWQPQDWGDLWRPDLRQRVSGIAQFREWLAISFRRLGLSINTPPPWPTDDLKAQLQTLHQQMLLYSDKHYIQPLILGDALLAVGWSSDLLPVAQRYPQIQVVVPPGGGAIWADGWVLPSGQSLSAGLQDWLNFGWEPAQTASLTAQGIAWSPFAPELADYEFFLPMDTATEAAYQSLRRWWAVLPPVGR